MIIFSEIGQELVSEEINYLGVSSINSYTDVVSGETLTKYFDKYYKYSTDSGISFSEWLPITELPLSTNFRDLIVLQYKYVRAGSDSSGVLVFESFEFNVTDVNLELSEFNKSIYKEFVEYQNTDSLEWTKAVMKRFNNRGFLHKNASRTDDYFDFWRALIYPLSFIVATGRKLSNFFDSQKLLYNFLSKKGFYVEYNDDILDLQTIANNQVNEIRRRGTNQIFRTTDEKGELQRLLISNDTDEFAFELNRLKTCLFLNRSYPEYKSSIYKAYEPTRDVNSLLYYPLINDNSNVSLFTDGNKKVMKITCAAGETAGIGLFDVNKCINIDYTVSYEISFYVRTENIADILTFGIKAYDENNNLFFFKNVSNDIDSNTFFQRKSLNKNDTYYYVRGVLFRSDSPLMPNNSCSIGFGNDLKINDFVVKIIPVILLDNSQEIVENSLYIWDVKIKALFKQSVFLGVNNTALMYARNNDFSKKETETKYHITNYLLPYNTQLFVEWLPPTSEQYQGRNYSDDYDYSYS